MTQNTVPAPRRFLTFVAGLGALALAVGAFVLTYDDLRELVLAGEAPKRYARWYPGLFDGLVVMTALAILVARHAGWWARTFRKLLLLLLLAGGAAASVQNRIDGYDELTGTWLSGGVAAAPWVILLIVAWLWLSMFRHVRRAMAERPGEEPAQAVEPLIPGFRPDTPSVHVVHVPEETRVDLLPERTAPTRVEETWPAAQAEATRPDLAIPPLVPRDDGDSSSYESTEEASEEPVPWEDTAEPVSRDTTQAHRSQIADISPDRQSGTTLPDDDAEDTELIGDDRAEDPDAPPAADEDPDAEAAPGTVTTSRSGTAPRTGTPGEAEAADAGSERGADSEQSADADAGSGGSEGSRGEAAPGEGEPGREAAAAARDVDRWGEEAAREAARWAADAANRFSGSSTEDKSAAADAEEPTPPEQEETPPASTFRSSPTPPRRAR